MRGSHDLSAVRFVMRLVSEHSVDVISTHSGHDSFIGAVAGRLSSRRPVIVRTRHLALPITSRMTYSLLPHRVVTVSEDVRRHLVEERKIPAGKVITVPTGVDITRFDPDSTPDTLRDELGVSPGTPLVGTVAIMRKKKGHMVLLDALPEIVEAVPDAVFVFAGDGPHRPAIEQRVAEIGASNRVRFLGLRKDVPVVLKGMDLFVLPTLQEALGTSILEASAMKKPVVSSRVGGVPEVVVEGVTGLLVEPEDPASLAAAIVRLLRDPARMKEMGEEGRRMVEDGYTIDRMVERMFSLYTGLLASRSGGGRLTEAERP
jgi:glycosyltransferase involved in cell wall biosynthesis